MTEAEKLKKLAEEELQAVKELREKLEKAQDGLITKADFKEAEDKINKHLEEIAEQKKAIDKQVTELKEANDRIDELETKIQRPGFGGNTKEGKPESTKAFEKWLRLGQKGLTPDEAKLLSPPEGKVLTITGDTGVSYLAPGEYVDTIIKGVTEISPIRQLADVKPTSSDYSEIPKRTGQFAAAWVSEIGSRTETTGLTYGMERIPNHEMYALVKVSTRALEDSAFNLEAELTSEFAEQFAKAEGTAFVTGSSVGKPEGFTVNGSVDITTVVHDASDAKIIVNGLIDLMHFLKTAYAQGSSLLCNRATIALLRKAQDANNKYYWEPDFQAGTPGLMMGTPIVEVPDMADCADGAKCLAIGNFKRGYVISDRVQIEIQRLVELYAESGQIGFIARKRVGGQVVLAEAIAIGVGQA